MRGGESAAFLFQGTKRNADRKIVCGTEYRQRTTPGRRCHRRSHHPHRAARSATRPDLVAASGGTPAACGPWRSIMPRSEEHTSELQSLMRISYAVCCVKKKTKK